MLAYLPNLAVLAAIGLLTYGTIGLARAFAQAIGTEALSVRGFCADWASPTYNLLKTLLIILALVVAFPYLPGGDSQALKGASIFVGVLVSLGSGSAMGNVISGVILTYMRPFAAGDRVRIAETEGDVVEKTLPVTRIRTIKNVDVIVPNSAILGTHITNYSANARHHGLIVHTTITVGYDAPWRTVHQLLINAARSTRGLLATPEPFVLQTSLNDFHVSYQINAFTSEPNRIAQIYSDLHQSIQEEFHRGGVEIMSPTYLSLRDGNTVTIPEGHRPAEYSAPRFRVDLGSGDRGTAPPGSD